MKVHRCLQLLLLAHFALVARSQNNPDARAVTLDPPKGGPQSLILPTRAGHLPSALKPTFSAFPEQTGICGKATGAFNPALPGANIEVYFDCSPHPMRVVVGTGFTNKPVAKLGFERCTGTQTCGAPSAQLTDKEGVLHNTTAQTVKSTDKDDYDKYGEIPNLCRGVAQDGTLFSNEEGCLGADYGITDVRGAQAAQRMVSRWLGNKELFRLIPPWTKHLIGIKPAMTAKWTNAFVTLPKKQPNQKFHSCTGTCDIGQLVKVTTEPNSWKMTIYLTGKTDGFKLCFDAANHEDDTQLPVCKQKGEMFLMVRNGVVVWPKTGRASLITLRSPNLGNTDVYAVEIGFGVTGDDGSIRGEFYVANQYREMVTSDTEGYDSKEAARIALFFPDELSLQQTGGVVSSYITAAKTLVSEPLVSKVKNQPVQNAMKGQAVAAGGENTANDAPEVKQPIIVSTTPAPIRIGSDAVAGAMLMATDGSNEAIYVAGKWWTWGVFIGFVIGVLLGVSIIAGIFYVLRRTVFGFWYRGMYKRYGCDVSGTTGGITGVGFGNTTTGAMTVGGTTGGGTTAGTTTGGGTTTSGGTTSGTTSGNTSKGSTSAMSGTSTIAM